MVMSVNSQRSQDRIFTQHNELHRVTSKEKSADITEMSDTTDMTENKREDEHNDKAIDVCLLVPEWKLRGTRDDPLTDGTRTELNENVTMKIFDNLMIFDLRVDSFSFGDEPKTNEHVDLLDFGCLLIDVTVKCSASRDRFACSTGTGCSSHTSTERTSLQFEVNDAITNVLSYDNYFWNLTEYTAECNALPTMMIVTVPTYVNYSRNRSEVVTQGQAKVLNKKFQNYDVTFFENLYYHKDEVRAVAAAAILTTHRGTYTFNANTNSAGIEWGHMMKLFEMDIRTAIFSNFSISRKVGTVGWQIADYKKQKHDCQNKKHAFRSSRQQKREAPALELDDTVLIGEDGSHPTECKYEDLFDGMYKKTLYVKTRTGRTVSVEADLNRDVESAKRQLEVKTGIPRDHQHLVSKGKVLKDNRTLKEYGISVGEVIDVTGKLWGGMKHKSLSPTPMDTERYKRKESEPKIDTSGLENANSQTESDEEMVTTKKKDDGGNETAEGKNGRRI